MDPREFAQRFQSIYPRLWLIAASMIGDRTEAEDIVQEAAIVAFGKLDTFEAGSNFAAWTTKIVRYCAANHNRKTNVRRTSAVDPSSLDDQVGANGLDARGLEVHALTTTQTVFDDRMLRVLGQLTADARACLLLRVVEDLSYEEISQLLEMPTGTAMSHVHRSKKLLRRVLETNDSSSKGAAE